MRKILVLLMMVTMLITGCGSKKEAKKQDDSWETETILYEDILYEDILVEEIHVEPVHVKGITITK